jgi:thiol:disulfide interchange protein DsbD
VVVLVRDDRDARLAGPRPESQRGFHPRDAAADDDEPHAPSRGVSLACAILFPDRLTSSQGERVHLFASAAAPTRLTPAYALLVSALGRAAVAALLGTAAEASAAAPGTGNVQAALVAETSSLQPGTPSWVGVQLRMAPGWHTYWRNAGDAGLPTRLTWTLPEGFTAGPIEWAYPQRFSQGPVTSYGYAGEVVLLTRITPPAAQAPGGQAVLSVRADWLECQEACLPGRATLTASLPVRADPARPDPAHAELFRGARLRLPQEATGWTMALRDANSGVSLIVRPGRPADPPRSAYFFAERSGLVDHAAPQALARDGNGFRLDLTLDANAARPLAGLDGVLVVDGTAGPQAIRVAARREGSTDKPGAGRQGCQEDRR